MNSLAIETREPRAQAITINEDSLSVDLMDGRTIIAPLIWYPRLWYGTAEERDNFEIICDGALIIGPTSMKISVLAVSWLDVDPAKVKNR
jgi:hypothetical protein